MFAAFELLRNEKGKKVLEEYYLPYLHLAEQFGLPFVLESPTWRANTDWGFKLGYTHDELFALNKQAIKFIWKIAQPFSNTIPQIISSGNIGPRGDGYKAESLMSAEHAKAYHLDQVKAFALADTMVVDYTTQLKSIDVPVLIFWGSNDSFCLKADQEKFIQNLKNEKLKVYDGTGHALHWEEPERFATDITTFVNRLKTVSI